MHKSKFEFFVIMQKRGDSQVYPDLHKTNGKIYYTEEDAQRELLFDTELMPYRHVIKMWAELADE